ncbi:MAG: helix-turn-helix transcriptional regulator [Gemmataceae bacterium]|nr:helix-turn-helix transcriptional regulator [Gemmataceae bacterium]
MGWVFRLEDLLDRMNEERRAQGRRPLTWAQVGRLLGMSRQAIQNLASNRGPKTTNSRFLEAFCRFFSCEPGDLLVLAPPRRAAPDQAEVDRLLELGRELRPEERPFYHVEILYDEGALRRWPRDRAAAERERE